MPKRRRKLAPLKKPRRSKPAEVLVGAPGGRMLCLVPFCRRTRKDDGRFDEWICGKHWTLTPRSWRRGLFLFRRRGVHHELVARMWDRLKRVAIERAAGL
jgi:hypothetical protein